MTFRAAHAERSKRVTPAAAPLAGPLCRVPEQIAESGMFRQVTLMAEIGVRHGSLIVPFILLCGVWASPALGAEPAQVETGHAAAHATDKAPAHAVHEHDPFEELQDTH